jgi:hypothetical protein
LDFIKLLILWIIYDAATKGRGEFSHSKSHLENVAAFVQKSPCGGSSNRIPAGPPGLLDDRLRLGRVCKRISDAISPDHAWQGWYAKREGNGGQHSPIAPASRDRGQLLRPTPARHQFTTNRNSRIRITASAQCPISF